MKINELEAKKMEAEGRYPYIAKEDVLFPFYIVNVRGPKPGQFGDQFDFDIEEIETEGNPNPRRTFSLQAAGRYHYRAYFEDNPEAEPLGPCTLEMVYTRSGNSFWRFVDWESAPLLEAGGQLGLPEPAPLRKKGA